MLKINKNMKIKARAEFNIDDIGFTLLDNKIYEVKVRSVETTIYKTTSSTYSISKYLAIYNKETWNENFESIEISGYFLFRTIKDLLSYLSNNVGKLDQ